MRVPFFDMHCHLDFASNADEAVARLHALGAGAFAVSVLPSPRACGRSASSVQWGVGLHPWWVASERASDEDVAALLDEIEQNIYIGEVGLDFGKTHGQRREEQVRIFAQVAHACARAGGRVLSIHAVRSAEVVLDVLEAAGVPDSCTSIFHWFSDSSEQLHRAVQAGCFFSVGTLMLRSKRGREYARQIPADRLLFETDEPAEGKPYDVDSMQIQLAETCVTIAGLRGVDPGTLAEQVAETSARLLSCG